MLFEAGHEIAVGVALVAELLLDVDEGAYVDVELALELLLDIDEDTPVEELPDTKLRIDDAVAEALPLPEELTTPDEVSEATKSLAPQIPGAFIAGPRLLLR